jgi:hypothetical protein
MVNSRRKGQTAERKLVKLFAAWWDSKFFRTPGSGAFATRGFVGVDTTQLSGDLVTTDTQFPFCVESKKVEGWTLEQMLSSNNTKIHSWWEQTTRETPEGKIPLLVFSKNHAPLYAMMLQRDVEAVLSKNYVNLFPNSFETTLEGQQVVIFLLDHLFKTPKGSWIYGR